MALETDSLQSLESAALKELRTASDDAALEAWHVTYFGRKDGQLTQVLRTLAQLPIVDLTI